MRKIFRLTTILLVFALVICTCAFCLVGCNFVKDPTEDSTEEVQSGLKLEVEDSSELSISLTPIEPEEYEAYGVSMAAESAYTLTATVAPSFTTYPNVTWTVLCEGVWASGKTLSDYVTLETNGNTAVLTCLQPFGSQITIRCSSEYNDSLYAECKLDYVKRIESVKFTCGSTGYYTDSDYSSERMYYAVLGFGDSVKIGCEVEYGVGTLKGDIEFGDITTTLAPNCFSSCTTAVTDTGFTVVESSKEFVNIDFNESLSSTITIGDISCFYTCIYSDPLLSTGYSQFSTALYNFCSSMSHSYHAKMLCTYSYSHDSLGTLNEGSFEMPISIDSDSFDVTPSGVSFRQNSFIF